MLLQTPTIYSHIKHRTFWQNCPIFSRLSHATRTSWRGSTTWKTEHSGKSVPLSADCPMQQGLAEVEVLHEKQNILANLSHFQQTVPCNKDWLKGKYYMKNRTFWQICPTFSRLSHATRTGWSGSTTWKTEHSGKSVPLSADCPMQRGLAEGEVLHETQNILANLSHFQQTVPCNEDWLKEKFYMKHRTFWQICPTFSRLSHAMRTGWRRSTINSYSHYISTCPCKHPHTHIH